MGTADEDALKGLATEAGGLDHTSSQAVLILKGLILGVIHALLQASRDKFNHEHEKEPTGELQHWAQALSQGNTKSNPEYERSTAGHYFNSALFRMDAALEVGLKRLFSVPMDSDCSSRTLVRMTGGIEEDEAEPLWEMHLEVCLLKHNISLVAARHIGMEDAMTCCKWLIKLAKRKPLGSGMPGNRDLWRTAEKLADNLKNKIKAKWKAKQKE